MKQSARLAADENAVRRFRNAYVGLAACDFRDQELRETVSEAAGAAAVVSARVGLTWHLGGMTRNPIADWRHSIGSELENIFSPSDIVSYCDQVIGIIEHKRESAEAEEMSLAGRVARIYSFPAEVRDAAGNTSKRTGQVAFWATIGAPLIVLVGGGLILHYIFLIG